MELKLTQCSPFVAAYIYEYRKLWVPSYECCVQSTALANVMLKFESYELELMNEVWITVDLLLMTLATTTPLDKFLDVRWGRLRWKGINSCVVVPVRGSCSQMERCFAFDPHRLLKLPLRSLLFGRQSNSIITVYADQKPYFNHYIHSMINREHVYDP
jgi:hypothetical protein